MFFPDTPLHKAAFANDGAQVSGQCSTRACLHLQHVHASLCLLCLAWLCLAWLCFALLCFALLCFALLCFALLCFALLCFALLCFALLCFALLCFALLCFALLCFVLALCASTLSLNMHMHTRGSKCCFDKDMSYSTDPHLHSVLCLAFTCLDMAYALCGC